MYSIQGAFLALLVVRSNCAVPSVIYAINAGGQDHTDINGILFQADPLEGVDDMGVAGLDEAIIEDTPIEDEILYQTDRQTESQCFGYDVPMPEGDSQYVLVLKFVDNYEIHPKRRTFDVILNSNHTVLKNFDIIEECSIYNMAVDVPVKFSIANGQLSYRNETSQLTDQSMRIDFCKGNVGRPIVSALYIVPGTLRDVPSKCGAPYSGIDRSASPIKYAINAGGHATTDSKGIQYDSDPLYGCGNVKSHKLYGDMSKADEKIYLSERYTPGGQFGYDIPVENGKSYVLTLKFSENYERENGGRIFDVVINKVYTVLGNFDLFNQAGGFQIPYDKDFMFRIENDMIIYGEKESEIMDGLLRVDFRETKDSKDLAPSQRVPIVSAIILLEKS